MSNNELMKIIGIDHGNHSIKGQNRFKYTSGYVDSSVEPVSSNNLLVYQGKYYSIGTERFPVLNDKTQDDSFFILSLPVIANSLLKRGLHQADICLAVGLPLISYGKLKGKFRNYFIRQNIEFEYQNEKFKVNIGEAYVFPQAYSAIMTKFNDYRDLSDAITIDIGGATVDIFLMENGIINLQRVESINEGVIQLFHTVQKAVLENGVLITEKQIEEIITGKTNPLFIDQNIIKIITQNTEQYVNRLLGKIKEENYEIKANPVIFTGGGSMLLKHFFERNRMLGYYEILDEFANVEGYRILAEQKLASSR